MLSGVFLTSVFCMLKEEKLTISKQPQNKTTSAYQNHLGVGLNYQCLGSIFRASGPSA